MLEINDFIAALARLLVAVVYPDRGRRITRYKGRLKSAGRVETAHYV